MGFHLPRSINLGNKNYTRGRITEWRCLAGLVAEGYSGTRAAGSHGCFDLIVWNDEKIRFIQCKREKKGRKKVVSPDIAYPSDAAQMRGCITPHNGVKELWVWVDREGFTRFRLEGDEWVVDSPGLEPGTIRL